MINYKEIEQRWQKAWADAKVYESEPGERKPFMVTAAFPYVNSPLHMGHIRTYGTADVFSRYKRMRGFNVLYPMAFHATGTPLLAFAKRIAANEKELIDELKAFHVQDNEIRMMTDPRYIAEYFVKNVESGMIAAGYGIDWRRKFVSIEPLFSKFVEWQFMKLKEKDYITKGSHPVGWCTNDNNAVGQHDTKHDVHPEIGKVTVVKFKDRDSDAYFCCATYRPETIYGVTNLFVEKDAKYVIAKYGASRIYLSKDAAENLKYQIDIEIESEITAESLLSRRAVNPIDGKEMPVLPGFFVKPDVGTGLVMSVPSHAPFDYVALRRLRKEGYPVPEFEYVKLVDIEKKEGIGIGRSLTDVNVGEAAPLHPELPALAYLEILKTDENAIDDMLEFATKLLYREESHWGIMLVGECKGMREPEAREFIKSKLEKENSAFQMYMLTNEEPVYCRCGFKAIVKLVKDQWFINYGDKKWKGDVMNYLPSIAIYPEKLRTTFQKVIDWIDLRAAEREQGLGTRFPFDKSYVIESLSDSTIYMCFYTFVHILRNEGIRPEQLMPEFFDCVLLSKGDQEDVSKSTGIDVPTITKCRESFEYWYSETSRHSGPDLVPNHLTMYIFNHIAVLERKDWPKNIVVNGFVNYEGEKMSKSLGNIVPVAEGIEKYGADPLRFIEIVGADLDTSTEFTSDGINSIQSKNEFLLRMVESLPEMKSKELSHMDYWLYSKLNSKIRAATAMMDGLNFKEAYTLVYYDSINELKRYAERGGANEIVIRDFLESTVLMIAPVMPHIAEELWSRLGKTTLVAQEKWPEFNESMINSDEEKMEDIVERTISDIRQGIELTSRIDSNKGRKVREVRIIVAEEWKATAFRLLSEKKAIAPVMSDEQLKDVGREALSKFISQYSKAIRTLNSSAIGSIKMEDLYRSFREATEYIGSKLNARIEVEMESSSKSARAARAGPDKPSMDILWD